MIVSFGSGRRGVDLLYVVRGDARSRQTVSSHAPLARIAGVTDHRETCR